VNDVESKEKILQVLGAVIESRGGKPKRGKKKKRSGRQKHVKENGGAMGDTSKRGKYVKEKCAKLSQGVNLRQAFGVLEKEEGVGLEKNERSCGQGLAERS